MSVKSILKKSKTLQYLVRKVRNSKDDRRILLLQSLPANSVGAEIGVWKGQFSKMILKHVSPSHLYLIDPWEYQPEFSERKYGGKESEGISDMQAIYESVRSTVGVHDNVSIIRKRSEEAASDIADQSLDWVYIDGNHFYKYVFSDLKNYSRKVKKLGFIICDDYTWGKKHNYPVKRAVHNFLKNNNKTRIESVKGDQVILKKE